MSTQVLMTADNPTGWKLEDLLKKLIEEVSVKDEKLIADTSPLSLYVRKNNARILESLRRAEISQLDSYSMLDRFKKNEGPLGAPRIGKGKDNV